MDWQEVKSKARVVLAPVVGVLASLGIPPLLVSLLGLSFSLYGAVVVAGGSLFLGAVFLILSGVSDVVDGDLARRINRETPFGAFLDSTVDRVTEFAYFGAIIMYTVNRPGGFHNFEVAVVIVALAGAVLTSYARARAEGLGLECKVGLLERPERIVLFAVGLVLGYRILIAIMTVLAVASLVTFLQRIAHVHRCTRDLPPPPPSDLPANDPPTD